mmetsp:Transcript_34618/g.83767  ORF Transcript_34618/g.83767 Transcript_34618/m.83767 type:complete len:148 (-) Transcript_34618:1027-1470(-)
MLLKYLGAAREVGKSSFLIMNDIDKKNNQPNYIILDAGITCKDNLNTYPLFLINFISTKNVYLCLSHFHLDHSGFLPIIASYTCSKIIIISSYYTKLLYFFNVKQMINADCKSKTILNIDDIEISMEILELFVENNTYKIFNSLVTI